MKKNKKKRKVNQRKNLWKILRDNAALITIGITVLAFVFNSLIHYYQKANNTEFYFQYVSVKIDEKVIQGFSDNSLLDVPTFHNELNQWLYRYPEQLKDYYMTYLIIEQRKNVDAENVTLHFKQYGSIEDLENKELSDFPIEEKVGKEVIKTVDYPFPKGEQLKIPISICKNETEYTMIPKDCYGMLLKPVSIAYQNQYLFSKKNVPIREYLEHNVVIDGEVVTGRGNTEEVNERKPWYLK